MIPGVLFRYLFVHLLFFFVFFLASFVLFHGFLLRGIWGLLFSRGASRFLLSSVSGRSAAASCPRRVCPCECAARSSPHRRWVQGTQPHTYGCAERILTAEFQLPRRFEEPPRVTRIWADPTAGASQLLIWHLASDIDRAGWMPLLGIYSCAPGLRRDQVLRAGGGIRV